MDDPTNAQHTEIVRMTLGPQAMTPVSSISKEEFPAAMRRTKQQIAFDQPLSLEQELPAPVYEGLKWTAFTIKGDFLISDDGADESFTAEAT